MSDSVVLIAFIQIFSVFAFVVAFTCGYAIGRGTV